MASSLFLYSHYPMLSRRMRPPSDMERVRAIQFVFILIICSFVVVRGSSRLQYANRGRGSSASTVSHPCKHFDDDFKTAHGRHNAAAATPEIRIPVLVSRNLTSAFPDLALWLSGPANLQRGVCEAMHPGLRRVPISIPIVGSTGQHAHDDRRKNASASAGPPPTSPIPVENIPVVVLSHDNPTYLHAMVRFLRCYGVADITVYDTASSLPLHLELLDALERVVTIQRVSTNDGPRSFMNASNLARLPRFFALTDADLRPHPDLPPNFLAYLAALTQAFPGRKAGFALDLSMKDQFLQGTYAGNLPISDWEERFWRAPLPTPKGGPPDTLYNARIDTTFAVYDKYALKSKADGTIQWSFEGVRVGGSFAATHLPWLCYATPKYMTVAEWDFLQKGKISWSTTGKLARKNAGNLGNACGGARG